MRKLLSSMADLCTNEIPRYDSMKHANDAIFGSRFFINEKKKFTFKILSTAAKLIRRLQVALPQLHIQDGRTFKSVCFLTYST